MLQHSADGSMFAWADGVRSVPRPLRCLPGQSLLFGRCPSAACHRTIRLHAARVSLLSLSPSLYDCLFAPFMPHCAAPQPGCARRQTIRRRAAGRWGQRRCSTLPCPALLCRGGKSWALTAPGDHASCSRARSTRIIATATGKLVGTIPRSRTALMAFSPNNTQVATWENYTAKKGADGKKEQVRATGTRACSPQGVAAGRSAASTLARARWHRAVRNERTLTLCLPAIAWVARAGCAKHGHLVHRHGPRTVRVHPPQPGELVRSPPPPPSLLSGGRFALGFVPDSAGGGEARGRFAFARALHGLCTGLLARS